MGYRMVFDRENLRFGWSRSSCHYTMGDRANFTSQWNGRSPNPLPANQQQSVPIHAVPPAVAGQASPKPSVATTRPIPSWHLLNSLSLICSLLFWLSDEVYLIYLSLSVLFKPSYFCGVYFSLGFCIYWG